MDNMFSTFYRSPIGLIQIQGTETAITGLDFIEGRVEEKTKTTPLLETCVSQLDEYFRGERKTFSLLLQPEGTMFREKVWEALQTIPYGETASYQGIAILTGNVKAVRAVGGANNKNRIAILIPCHRVIGKNGKLVGYAGGLWRKEWLLKFEKQHI